MMRNCPRCGCERINHYCHNCGTKVYTKEEFDEMSDE